MWTEANGTPYAGGILSLNDMSFFSYFAGPTPNGSGARADYNWGQGEAAGANRIYGTTAKTTNIRVGDFEGLTYYYDNTNFFIDVVFINNLPPNAPFPPPPTDNDLNITAALYDSTYTFSYVSGGNMVPSGGGNYNATISTTTTPIIFRAYWIVNIIATPLLIPGALVDISINGNNLVTAGAIPPGGLTSFDGITYGTEDVAGTGLIIQVICY
jgi:hypothetical protein